MRSFHTLLAAASVSVTNASPFAKGQAQAGLVPVHGLEYTTQYPNPSVYNSPPPPPAYTPFSSFAQSYGTPSAPVYAPSSSYSYTAYETTETATIYTTTTLSPLSYPVASQISDGQVQGPGSYASATVARSTPPIYSIPAYSSPVYPSAPCSSPAPFYPVPQNSSAAPTAYSTPVVYSTPAPSAPVYTSAPYIPPSPPIYANTSVPLVSQISDGQPQAPGSTYAATSSAPAVYSSPTVIYSSAPILSSPAPYPVPVNASVPVATPSAASIPAPVYSSAAAPPPVYSSAYTPESSPSAAPPVYSSAPAPAPVYTSSPAPAPAPEYSSSPVAESGAPAPAPAPAPVYTSSAAPAPVYSRSPIAESGAPAPAPAPAPVYSSGPLVSQIADGQVQGPATGVLAAHTSAASGYGGGGAVTLAPYVPGNEAGRPAAGVVGAFVAAVAAVAVG